VLLLPLLLPVLLLLLLLLPFNHRRLQPQEAAQDDRPQAHGLVGAAAA
jgi:hypothetical protein